MCRSSPLMLVTHVVDVEFEIKYSRSRETPCVIPIYTVLLYNVITHTLYC